MRERERERETDRQTDRQKQRDRETERQRQRQGHRDRETETERDRQTERHTQTDRQTDRESAIPGPIAGYLYYYVRMQTGFHEFFVFFHLATVLGVGYSTTRNAYVMISKRSRISVSITTPFCIKYTLIGSRGRD